MTALVLTVNVTLLAPAGTVTLEGTLAAVLLLESATCAPPMTLVGFRVTEERERVGRGEDCSKIRTAGLGSLNGTATNFDGEMT